MASEVDICNLALAYLGDSATVASIDPPEGSAQSEHCARFYPVARDTLLSAHAWSFATRYEVMTQLQSQAPGWQFAYVRPNDALTILEVLQEGAPALVSGQHDAQVNQYETGATAGGQLAIFTNAPRAGVRFVARERSTALYPALFVTALSWQLASMLAGPVIKGEAGMAEAKRCAAVAQEYLAMARATDANQSRPEIKRTPMAIAARGGV